MPEFEDQVDEVFERAVALDAAAREAMLGGHDAAVAAEVRRLLAHDASMSDAFLAGAPLVESAPSDDASMPERIGDYVVVGPLGRGGMGAVYEARQERLNRHVAIKLIRPELTTPAILRRFETEAEILGALQHPGIARIYEVGRVALDGVERPYIVMELIDGLPLVKHASTSGLDLAQRLELVARVADAVQHAHQKGIMHRDLKPPNILVVAGEETAPGSGAGSHPVIDETGRPCILDFGVARTMDRDAQATIQTHAGQIVGTLAYMAPEQIAGRSMDVDTRCDVYALGAILFELLCGRVPHDLHGRSIAESARVIQEEPAPSAGALVPALRGDVETIIAKALAKEPDQRYATAAELAADLRRFNRDEPILARPASMTYRLRKFARRNRAVAVAGVIAIVALVVGFGAAAGGLLRAGAENRAKQAALDDEQASRLASDAVTDFFAEIMSSPHPGEAGRDVTVREVMADAASRIAGRFDQRPVVEARIRSAIAQTQMGLGEYEAAREQLERALAIWDAHDDREPDRVRAAEAALVLTLHGLGEYDAALDLSARNVEDLRAARDAGGRARVAVLSSRGIVLVQRGQYAEAEPLLREAHAIADAEFGAGSKEAIESLTSLGLLLSYDRRYDESIAVYEDAIDRSRAHLGEDHPDTLQLIANLATVYKNTQRVDEAAPLLRRVLEGQERQLGPEHAHTLTTLNNVADMLRVSGDLDGALELVQDGLRRAREAYGEDGSSTLHLLYALGKVHMSRKEFDEAEAVLLDAIERHERLHGAQSVGAFYSEYELVRVHLSRKDYARALAQAESIHARSASLGAEHPWVRSAVTFRMLALTGLERYDEAERILLDRYEADTPEQRPLTMTRIVRLYEAWGREDEASIWRERAEGS